MSNTIADDLQDTVAQSAASTAVTKIQLSDSSPLYTEYTPALTSFYEVEISGGDEAAESDIINDYIQLHATRIEFGDEVLQLERNAVTKNFQLKEGSYSRASTLSITWRESDDWRVKKYHENWVGLFYDRNTDRYKSCFTDSERARLYRTFRIRLRSEYDSTPNKNNTLVFCRVLPSNIGGLNMEWSTRPGIVTHQYSYYVSDWRWETSEDLNKSTTISSGI